MTDPSGSEERDVLAGELALGILDGEDRARANRLRLSDPAFAADVAAWNQRLSPLGMGFGEQPSPALWPAIQHRLGASDATRLERGLRRWRLGAIAGGVLAASLAAIIVLRPTPAPVEIVREPERVAVAQLGAEGTPALFAVNYDPAGGLLRIRAMRLPGSALAPELWVIPADGVPRSLGLVAPSGVSKVAVSAEHRSLLQEGATLAITLEPRDGAPHDAPSSTPIAAGKISTI
ncbi:anti-sigma factor [Sphingobium sp.]|uniref:anti-sigma factor n=1 Tax=Sphingobium sp. TaxID=1912891 RepID=UPI002C0B8DBA|nr:anti-sigma factor [Sphingobium sp.]HUD92882.1 anti-sigma factor [Sphingobium sp.]